MLKNFLKSFLKFLYINKCIICNSKAEGHICNKCLNEIDFLATYPHKIYNSVSIYSASVYEESIKKLIKKLKFYHRKNASMPLAEILFRYFKKLELNKNFIVIYPPSFFLKNSTRGYCHIELIAKNFIQLCEKENINVKLENKLIKKIKYTKPQYKARNRRKNIEKSFEINQNIVNSYKNSSILIIDDITTSGATLEVLIDLLKENNINDITCLTVAKAGK